MKFTKTHKDWNGNFLETISIETKDDLLLDDALEAFGRFLRATGYHFDGEIQIVDDNEKYLDDTQDWNFDDDFEEGEETVSPAFEGPIEGFNKDLPIPPITVAQVEQWPFPIESKP